MLEHQRDGLPEETRVSTRSLRSKDGAHDGDDDDGGVPSATGIVAGLGPGGPGSRGGATAKRTVRKGVPSAASALDKSLGETEIDDDFEVRHHSRWIKTSARLPGSERRSGGRDRVGPSSARASSPAR
jgi:hypothetical protein